MTEELRALLTKELHAARLGIIACEREAVELTKRAVQLRHDEAVLAAALGLEANDSECPELGA